MPTTVRLPADGPPKGRSLVPKSGNDRIYTPDPLAIDIGRYFEPTRRIIQPAAAGGAFLRALPAATNWFMLHLGKDFLMAQDHWNWLITYPPYTQFLPFFLKALEDADNIVFLCLENSQAIRARRRAIQEAGFDIVEQLRVPDSTGVAATRLLTVCDLVASGSDWWHPHHQTSCHSLVGLGETLTPETQG